MQGCKTEQSYQTRHLRRDSPQAPPTAPSTPPAQQPKAQPPSQINPYTGYIHEHPAVLLAEPTPTALREMIASGLASGLEPALDLGCGSGNFLIGMAARHPELGFVGFELRYKRLVKAARKIERDGLQNAWLVRDVAERFHHYFEPGSLARVYVNFPDPWPKPSQWKRRLVSAAFLKRLSRVLKPGGRFCFKTDHSGYFLHVLSLLPQVPELKIRLFHNDFESSGRATQTARSEFQQLFRMIGKPVFYLELDKPSATG